MKSSVLKASAIPRPARKEEPDFERLRYFKESGWLGFALEIWGEYFSAPLYAEMYKRYDILRDEFSVLASLYDCGSLTARTICAITGRPKNSVSRGVARLIASGRIKSVTNPTDRREAFLSLMPEGKKLYEKILPLCRERERALLGGLSTEELVSLDKLMMRIMLLYHQSPEGVGISTLAQLGIPNKIEPDDL